jgi:imidazolonepropionase-like amidohydrolase
MRRILQVLSLVLVLLFAVSIQAKTIAIKAGLLIADARKAPISNAVLIIEDGKITSVGGTIPAGAEVIDLSAFTVMPGLMDGHAHLWTSDTPDPLLHMSASERALYAQVTVRNALESGVTAMRVLASEDFLDVALRNTINAGLIPGPHVLAAGYALSIPGGHGDNLPFSDTLRFDDFYTPAHGFVNSPDQVEEAVHWQLKHGADLIKIFASGGASSPLDDSSQESLSPEEVRRAATVAHSLGKRIAAHAQNNRSIRSCIEAGVDSIEHGSDLDEATIALLKQRHIYLDMAPIHRLEVAGKQFANSQEVKWVKRRKLYRMQVASFQLALKSDGLLWSAGSDVSYAPNTPTLTTELEKWVELGMPRRVALVSATVNNAALFNMPDVGTLEVGKTADLIACRGNPLDHIQALEQIVLVMKAGIVYVNRTR